MENKLLKLQQYIQNTNGIAVAFSGGVDSTFLVAVAAQTIPDKVVAITARSAAFPEREYKIAESIAEKYGVKHVTAEFDEMSLEGFYKNPKDRCYHCKKAIFTMIKQKAQENGINTVADGSNVDDLGDYRPGMKALNELEIVSPLREAGLTKAEIRLLSKQMGLETWDMPPYACLASRIPYGEEITKRKLKMVEEAEEYFMKLGFEQIRVRCHGELARIEVTPQERVRFFNTDFMDQVAERLKSIGFSYTSLDLKGYRTGSLNEILSDTDRS
jgi:TIGR00268 family protein